MSTLLGGPGARYPLDKAVDELAAAGRWAGRPGFVWLAGFYFPSLLINLGAVQGLVQLFGHLMGREINLGFLTGGSTLAIPLLPSLDAGNAKEMVIKTLVLIPLALVVYRLQVGLAAIAAPDADEAPGETRRTLRAAWRAGRGQTRAALGMWIGLLLLLVGVLAFLFGPALVLVQLFSIDDAPVLLTLIAAPTALLGMGYGVVLLVLHMLALQSLAHNRRGVSSALTHAWRLMRADPWGAVRACLVDLSLQALLIVAKIATSVVLSVIFVGIPLIGLVHLVLYGVAGVTRAAFWARTYRALGGPLSSDRLPGLGM